MQQFRDAMSRALFLANRASSAGDVPVGAVVLDPLGRVIGEGWNVREAHRDPTGHAEVMALRQAGERLKRWNLVGCTLVVTLEPCTMCAGAAVAARVDRVVFGAWEPKTGAAGSLRDVLRDSRLGHSIEVIPGVFAQEASAQLVSFFEECRRREALRDRVPPALAPSWEDADVASRRLTAQLRAEAARSSRSWEGEGAGRAVSRVLADDELLSVEWDEVARAKYGNLPKVPALPTGPRYGTLSPAELRALDAARKGVPLEDASVDEAPAASFGPSEEFVRSAERARRVIAEWDIAPQDHPLAGGGVSGDRSEVGVPAGSVEGSVDVSAPVVFDVPVGASELPENDLPFEGSEPVGVEPSEVSQQNAAAPLATSARQESLPPSAHQERTERQERATHQERAMQQEVASGAHSEPDPALSDERLQVLPPELRTVIAGIAERRRR